MQEVSYNYIETYTSRAWGKRFIDELTKHTKKTDELVSVQQLKYEDVLGPYRTSKSRLLVLNYDGGLLDYTTENFVSTSRPSARILECLQALSDDNRNAIFIFSGREREVLQNWFGGIQGLGLVAEHGFFLKPPHEEQWYKLEALDLSWMNLIRPVLEYFKERTPGSEIEQKEVHMVWHYRRCRPDYGLLQARELYQTISAIHDVAVELVHDSELRTVEIRPPVVNATPPVMSSFNQLNPEFVMHVGNRQTAEKIRHHFENRVAENRLFTCIVGRSSATTPQLYERRLGRVSSTDSMGAGGEIEKSTYIDKPTDVLDFLKFLACQAPEPLQKSEATALPSSDVSEPVASRSSKTIM
jgi:trehalose 6-phosphate synthase/phosphatase